MSADVAAGANHERRQLWTRYIFAAVSGFWRAGWGSGGYAGGLTSVESGSANLRLGLILGCCRQPTPACTHEDFSSGALPCAPHALMLAW